MKDWQEPKWMKVQKPAWRVSDSAVALRFRASRRRLESKRFRSGEL